jgi:outer membrane lipoprotein-sorting protein
MRFASTMVTAGALLLAAGGAGARAQGLSPADRADVARVEAYINGITTFKADFAQIAPTGATARGTIWMSRPGRLRVEYHPPSKLRIFATPQWLIVEDCKSREPQHLPLRATPAGILVQDRVSLSGELSVTSVTREAQRLTLTVVETKSPEKGQMRLAFRANPLQLIGWTVIDQNGSATRVSLENAEAGLPIDRDQLVFSGKCEQGAPRLGR